MLVDNVLHYNEIVLYEYVFRDWFLNRKCDVIDIFIKSLFFSII